MSTTLQAMQPVVHGANIVSKVEDVHLHMRLSLKESCQKLESTTLTLGQNPSDNFGVQVQTHWVPGCDAGAEEGHECL